MRDRAADAFPAARSDQWLPAETGHQLWKSSDCKAQLARRWRFRPVTAARPRRNFTAFPHCHAAIREAAPKILFERLGGGEYKPSVG